MRIQTDKSSVAQRSTPATATAEITSLPSSAVKGRIESELRGNTQTPYDSYTKLLMHFEGTDTSTTFTDQTGKTVTPSGDAQIDTAQYKFGSASGLFDGTGDYLTVDASDGSLDIGTNDFCIEFWVRLNSTGATQVLVDFRQVSSTEIAPRIDIDTTTKLMRLHVNGVNVITGTTLFTTGTWYHVAVTRSSGVTKLFVNGGQEGSSYTDANNYIGVSSIVLGGNFSGLFTLNGWLDELRISVGTARYTSNFSPLPCSVLSSDRVRVKSVGKNLFDKSSAEIQAGYLSSTGTISASTDYKVSQFIRVASNTSYYLSGLTYARSGVVYAAYYDTYKNLISTILMQTSSTPTNTGNKVYTTPSNATYIRFTIRDTDTNRELLTCQLELGSTATTYEAYTETTAIMPVELKKISSTVYDKFEANIGKFTKNCSDWVTLSGNAYTWGFTLDFVGYKLITTPLSAFSGIIASGSSSRVIKYNNKELISIANGYAATDQVTHTSSNLALTISNADTGWDESWVSGTSFTGMTWGGLIKANQNGWKLTTVNTNVASCVWTGKASGTVKNAGAADYTHVTTTIDTGFTPDKMIYQLATPVVTNYYPNIIRSEPSGTVYVEPFIEDYDFYNSGAFVRNTSYPIASLEYVYTVDRTTGVMTPIALSTCTIAAGGLSFTSTALAANDVVVFGYIHQYLSTVADMYYSYDVNLIGAVEDNSKSIRDLDVKIEQVKFQNEQRFDGVWKDYNVGAVSLGNGASAPDLVAVAGGTMYLPGFDGGSTVEQLFGAIELDHDYKEGSDITFHMHWMPTTADAGNVLFKLTYNWTQNGETDGAGTSVDLSTVAAGGTAWVNKISTVSISGTGKKIGSQFSFRLYRDPTDGSDTYGADAVVKTVGIHAQTDSHGSRGIATK